MSNWISRQLGQQLRQPKGLLGKLVGRMMNIGNRPFYETALRLLDLRPNQSVLEIGFGNGAYIDTIAQQIKPGSFFGIDLSETMLAAAQRRNKELIQRKSVQLQLGRAEALPFADQQFDRILSIHTIYFWDDPTLVLTEINRCLRVGGILVLGMNSKAALEKSSYSQETFRLYDTTELQELLQQHGFSEIQIEYRPLQVEDLLCIRAEKR